MTNRFITFIKTHWSRILSVGFFIFLSGVYMYIFAVFAPGTELNPNCGPTDSGCTVTVASFPDQTGSSGKFLTTDGTDVSWADAGDVAFDGNRTVTRSGITQINPGGTTISEFLENYFYPAVAPGASISGGNNREFGSSTAVSLSWTSTKNTNNITAVTITTSAPATVTAGSGQTQTNSQTSTVTSPTSSGQSGSTTGTTGTDTNADFTLTVTAGAQSNSSTTSVTYYNKRYAGVASEDIDTFDENDIKALSSSYTGLASGRTSSSITHSPSAQYIYYAWPASFEPGGGCKSVDSVTLISQGTVDCFNSALGAVTDFRKRTSVTYSNGAYSTTYNVYRSANLLNSSTAFFIN